MSLGAAVCAESPHLPCTLPRMSDLMLLNSTSEVRLKSSLASWSIWRIIYGTHVKAESKNGDKWHFFLSQVGQSNMKSYLAAQPIVWTASSYLNGAQLKTGNQQGSFHASGAHSCKWCRWTKLKQAWQNSGCDVLDVCLLGFNDNH